MTRSTKAWDLDDDLVARRGCEQYSILTLQGARGHIVGKNFVQSFAVRSTQIVVDWNHGGNHEAHRR